MGVTVHRFINFKNHEVSSSDKKNDRTQTAIAQEGQEGQKGQKGQKAPPEQV